MLSEFQRTLGIEVQENTGESAVFILSVEDALLNTFGIAHGGNHIALGNAAMKALVGTDATQMCCSIEYLDRVEAESRLRAEARLLRKGRSFVFAEADLLVGERMVARLSAQYSRLFEADKVVCQSKPDVRKVSSSIRLSRDYDVKMPEQNRIIRNLFNQRDLLTVLTESEDGLCLSLETGDYHAGLDGYIDQAVYGILADNALGFSCFAQGNVVVTARLTVNSIEPIKVGATLFCEAHVDGCSGNISFSSGNIWVDDKIVATCEGIFSAVMTLEEFKKTFK